MPFPSPFRTPTPRPRPGSGLTVCCCLQTESFKLSEPYSQCTEDGSDVPIKNIYNAVYSLQVRAAGDTLPWVVAGPRRQSYI